MDRRTKGIKANYIWIVVVLSMSVHTSVRPSHIWFPLNNLSKSYETQGQ
jgi:hypothetical protein